MLILNATAIPWEKRYKYLLQYRRDLKLSLRLNPGNEKIAASLAKVELEIAQSAKN